MTNEEIFIQFLKKHRKYSSYKRQFNPIPVTPLVCNCRLDNAIPYGVFITEAVEGMEYWTVLHEDWKKLIDHFQLKGRLNLFTVVGRENPR